MQSVLFQSQVTTAERNVHRDIAFEFVSWLSPEFKLYLVTEFQRLKAQEQKVLEWSAKRELAKVNYRIHTDAIKENIVPSLLKRRRNGGKKILLSKAISATMRQSNSYL